MSQSSLAPLALANVSLIDLTESSLFVVSASEHFGVETGQIILLSFESETEEQLCTCSSFEKANDRHLCLCSLLGFMRVRFDTAIKMLCITSCQETTL